MNKQDTELSSLVWRFALDEEIDRKIPGMLRRVSLSMYGQIWWRLMCYDQWPYKFCRLVDGTSDPMTAPRKVSLRRSTVASFPNRMLDIA